MLGNAMQSMNQMDRMKLKKKIKKIKKNTGRVYMKMKYSA